MLDISKTENTEPWGGGGTKKKQKKQTRQKFLKMYGYLIFTGIIIYRFTVLQSMEDLKFIHFYLLYLHYLCLFLVLLLFFFPL